MTTAERLIKHLIEEDFGLATAESCTGGLIAATITEIPGVSAIYLGGVIAYADEVKQELLGVRSETLESCGAVSEEVAEEMVRGVCRRMNAHTGIATTGIAGPSGGTREKPVGTVYVATQVGQEVFVTLNQLGGNRDHIRRKTLEQGMAQLLRMLG